MPHFTLLILLVLTLVLGGCSASMVQQRYNELVKMQGIKLRAWNQALRESAAYCKEKPSECRIRLIKISAEVSRENDWYRLNMPPYMNVIERYEDLFTAAAEDILPMDQRLTDEIKVFSGLADSGAITEDQGRQLATEAFRNFRKNLIAEVNGFQYKYRVALQSDRAIHNAIIAGIAAGALVATTTPAYSAPTAPSIQTFTIITRGRLLSCTSSLNVINCF